MALTDDVILVTKDTYPALFEALERVSHDCGRQAGHQNYPVPLSWKSKLADIDRQLQYLLTHADSDFDVLCTGDEEEKNAVIRGYATAGRRLPLLPEADQLLQRFFEEWS